MLPRRLAVLAIMIPTIAAAQGPGPFKYPDARKAELVKQKYFSGLTLEEAAAVLGISERTAKRDWTYARAWLFNEVQRLRGESTP